jgi:hypothetical protein
MTLLKHALAVFTTVHAGAHIAGTGRLGGLLVSRPGEHDRPTNNGFVERMTTDIPHAASPSTQRATALVAAEEHTRSSYGIAQICYTKEIGSHSQPNCAPVDRVVIKIASEPVVPTRLIGAEVAAEFTPAARHVEGQDDTGPMGDDLPDDSRCGDALIDDKGDRRIGTDAT